MKYSGIIFDMDGVLLNSTACHENAFKKVLASYPIKKFCYAEIAGMHTKAAFEKVFHENNVQVSNKELNLCITAKRNYAFEALNGMDPIEKSANKVIKTLSEKYKVALASSASKRLVEWFVEKSKSKEYLTVYLSGDEVSQAKPSPEIYLQAAHRLHLRPEDCAVIEDAESGIESAIRAGMDVYVKLGTMKEAPKGKTKIVASFRKLEALLDLL